MHLCIYYSYVRSSLATQNTITLVLNRYSTRNLTTMKAFQVTELAHPSKINVYVAPFKFGISRQDEGGS